MTAQPPGSFLAGRAAASLVRSRASDSRVPFDEVKGRALAAPPAPRLDRADFTLIAEVKLAQDKLREAETNFEKALAIDAKSSPTL